MKKMMKKTAKKNQTKPARRNKTLSKSKKIRYAVVGLGHIAQTAMLPAFKHAQTNSELVAFITGDPVKGKELSRKYKVEHVFGYEEFEEFLALGLADAIYIALPNSMHAEIAVRAMKAGLHALCEKPLALTLKDTLAMGNAAKKYGVKLMTAYRLHFDRANLKAAEVATSGQLGNLRYFSSNFSYKIKDSNNIRLQADVGGGPLWDIGIYCVNAIRNVFRDEPSEVFAYASKTSLKKFKEVEEGVSAILKFADGRLASFNCSFGAHDEASYEVVGTKGSLCLESAYEYVEARELTIETEKDGKKVHKYKKADQFAPELVYFSDCIAHDRKVEPSFIEGMADVKIILALYKSIETGKPVAVSSSPRVNAKRRPTMRMKMRYPGVAEPDTVHVDSPH